MQVREPATDIVAVVDAAPFGRFQWSVILLCGLIAMLDGFDTQAVAFVAPLLAQSWGLGPAVLGWVFAAGLVGIMVGQLVLGPPALAVEGHA